MEYFISNFKSQTLKSVGCAMLASFVVTYLFWNGENFISFLQGSSPFFLVPFSFFIPFFINIVIYTTCIALLISKKGIKHGLLLGFILLIVGLSPSFVSSAFNDAPSVTLFVYSMIVIDNIIRYVLPTVFLSYFRKH